MASRSTQKALLTAEQFTAGLRNLSEIERIRLTKQSKIHCGGTGWEPNDLLHESIVRTIDAGGRNCPADIPIVQHLDQTMRSIAHGERLKRRREPASGTGDDECGPLGTASQPGTSDIDRIDFDEKIAELQRLFDDDIQAQAILIGRLEGWSPSEIKELEPMDDKQYASACRRVRRAIEKHFSGE